MPKNATPKAPKKSATNGKAPKGKPEVDGLKYPVYRSEDYVGEKALTAADAKELLGWEEVQDDDYQFHDMVDNRIRCRFNTKNRPLDRGHALTLSQKILHKHWAGPNGLGKTPNGESMSIGQSGQVLSGQHRLIGLILAAQVWGYEGDDAELTEKAAHFRAIWGEQEPVMDCTVVFGVSEDADTMATLDNVKPRSFADTLYCDPDTFPKIKGKDRVKACRMADTAVRELWFRTGEKNDPFSPKRTHQEAWMWLKNHGRLKESLSFIFGNDGDGQISGQKSIIRIPAGCAAALHYLMSASTTDPEVYFANDPRVEKAGRKTFVDFSMAEKADEFWVNLVSGNPQFKGLRQALGQPFGEDYHGEFGAQDKMHVLVLGWNQFKDGGRLTKMETFTLQYDEDGEVRTASEFPEIGGIDKGEAKKPKPEKLDKDDDEEEDTQETDDTGDEDYDVDEEEEAPKPKRGKGKKAPKPVEEEEEVEETEEEEEEDEEDAAAAKREKQKAALLKARAAKAGKGKKPKDDDEEDEETEEAEEEEELEEEESEDEDSDEEEEEDEAAGDEDYE